MNCLSHKYISITLVILSLRNSMSPITYFLGLTSLVKILGSSSAPSLTDMSIINGLLGCLNHMLPAARLNSAWCIRQIVLSLPTMLTNILDQLIKRLKDFRSNKNAVEGHCAAIASILSVSNQTSPDGIVSGRCTKILHLTTELLKPVNEHYLGLSRVMGSWLLFSALLSVKGRVVKWIAKNCNFLFLQIEIRLFVIINEF